MFNSVSKGLVRLLIFVSVISTLSFLMFNSVSKGLVRLLIFASVISALLLIFNSVSKGLVRLLIFASVISALLLMFNSVSKGLVSAAIFVIESSKLLWIPTSNGFPNVFVNAFPSSFALFVVASKLFWIDVIFPSIDFILSLNGFPNAFFPRITADLVASSFIFIRDETISFKPREILAAPANSAIVFNDLPIPLIKRSD